MNRLAIPFLINDLILKIKVKITPFHNTLISVFTDILNDSNFKDKML